MRISGTFWHSSWLAVVAAGCLLGASGCGSSDQTGQSTASTASGKSHKPHKSSAPSKPGEEPLSDMVAAVSGSKAGPPVDLKFSLPVRPEVGQVTDIDVAVVPLEPVPDNVSVSFQVVDGLEIVDGSQLDRVEKLTGGTPIRHVVKILPKRDGIFALTAVVSFTASSQELNRTFTIPVIAGEGMPDQVAKGP
ncbi:MAG TPA: hypothetical protein VNO35_10060 [Steroidobacteraceae bacterium]|nr:hypothetical protein [Steroidobacteraceae bacterium]